ncbi:MAG TPA: DUF192 domain-containing protein [Candidatus Limnocylindrales bacterium]|jgi:hypothetical protein|nr:DUF192 domain-containing protein [Candidatus Limnocylindrales bacterium]
MAEVRALRNETRGTVLAERVVTASSFWPRFRGLMLRASLEPGEGLWLPGTTSVHMSFMRFPIDCVFLGPDLDEGRRRVVDLRPSLAPWRGIVWWARGADGVVELAAGTLGRTSTEVGDEVAFGAP